MTREFILARLAYLRAMERNFNRRTMRWDKFFYETPTPKIHIADLDFDSLSDEDLVEIFERIIRQSAKQM